MRRRKRVPERGGVRKCPAPSARCLSPAAEGLRLVLELSGSSQAGNAHGPTPLHQGLTPEDWTRTPARWRRSGGCGACTAPRPPPALCRESRAERSGEGAGAGGGKPARVLVPAAGRVGTGEASSGTLPSGLGSLVQEGQRTTENSPAETQ